MRLSLRYVECHRVVYHRVLLSVTMPAAAGCEADLHLKTAMNRGSPFWATVQGVHRRTERGGGHDCAVRAAAHGSAHVGRLPVGEVGLGHPCLVRCSHRHVCAGTVHYTWVPPDHHYDTTLGYHQTVTMTLSLWGCTLHLGTTRPSL